MSPDRATTLVKSSILLDKLGSLVRAQYRPPPERPRWPGFVSPRAVSLWPFRTDGIGNVAGSSNDPTVTSCSTCAAENPAGQKFCGECGEPLSVGVTAAAPTGAAVQVAQPPPAAERRLVSVLFADLVGFTTASEGRDAEDTRELPARYFELARTLVARYGRKWGRACS
jgi:hypothetical protein